MPGDDSLSDSCTSDRCCFPNLEDNSQPHKRHLTSKLNSKTVLVLYSLVPSPIFPYHLLPSPVHPTGFSFCFFPGFLAIFIEQQRQKYYLIL